MAWQHVSLTCARRFLSTDCPQEMEGIDGRELYALDVQDLMDVGMKKLKAKA